MRKFRQKYYDLFLKVYDRFVALHASHKQGVLRDILAEQTDDWRLQYHQMLA